MCVCVCVLGWARGGEWWGGWARLGWYEVRMLDCVYELSRPEDRPGQARPTLSLVWASRTLPGQVCQSLAPAETAGLNIPHLTLACCHHGGWTDSSRTRYKVAHTGPGYSLSLITQSYTGQTQTHNHSL